MKILTLASILLLGVSASPIMAASYTVKKGDTLYRIARQHGVSAQSLMKLNGIGSSSMIVPGQKLKVSGSASTKSVSSKPKSTNSTTGSHRVAKGDTFYGIARKHGISTSKLKALNPSVNPDRIRIGTKLKTAGTVSSPKPVSKPKTSVKSTPKKTSKPVARTASKPAAPVASKPKAPAIAKQPAPIDRSPLPIPVSAPISQPEPASIPTSSEPFIEPNIDLEFNTLSSSTVSAPVKEQAPEQPETISSITVNKEVTYSTFAEQHGATTSQLNELNGLSLKSTTMLARGSELYVPSSF